MTSRDARELGGNSGELGDRRNVFSYGWKRLVLLIMIGDFKNPGKLPVCPQFAPVSSTVSSSVVKLRVLHPPSNAVKNALEDY